MEEKVGFEVDYLRRSEEAGARRKIRESMSRGGGFVRGRRWRAMAEGGCWHGVGVSGVELARSVLRCGKGGRVERLDPVTDISIDVF